MPYVEDLANDPEGDIQRSNKPFDTDPRSQREIDDYNNRQKAKTELRNDRRQWERYRLVLPNDTPKTLSGFRSSKKANSNKWKDLQSDYKFVMNNSQNSGIIKIEKLLEGSGIDKKAMPAIDKAFTEVLDSGRRNNAENLYHLNLKTNSKAIKTLIGNNSQVEFTPELTKFLEAAPTNSVLSIHNHPRNSSFSPADMYVTTNYKSIKVLTVIAHDGTLYSLEVGNGSRLSFERIKEIYDDKRFSSYGHYKNKVDSGELTEQQAWKENSHQINIEIANKLNWKYRRVLPDE